MSPSRILAFTAPVFALAIRLAAQSPGADAERPAIARGVAFLSAESSHWRHDRGCGSCHHNGDAARALLVASRRGYDVGAALDETLAFLSDPAAWERNPQDKSFSDPALARMEFASALGVAARFDRAPDAAIKTAANLLVAHQGADGSWALDTPSQEVTAAAAGPLVAAWLGRGTLMAAGREPDDFAVVSVDRWLRGASFDGVADAAALILGLDVAEDPMAERLRADALRLLRERQAADGGWAATAGGAPDVFVSALAVLALRTCESEAGLARKVYRLEELRDAIQHGHAFLLAQQAADGGWPAARGASGQPSGAQRVSTTSWALLALLGLGGS